MTGATPAGADRGGPPADRRRATAERNAAAILDAAESLLGRGARLTMAAIAAEAGVSRPTLYAHFAAVGDVVEAAVERSVILSISAFDAAEPSVGPPDQALERLLAASWDQLARFDALARGAAEHLTPGAVHRTHAPLMERAAALVERGRAEGAFRTDLPAEWVVSVLFALVHGADEHVRSHGLDRRRGLDLLSATARDVVGARRARARSAPGRP